MPDPIEKFQTFWRTLAPKEQSDLYTVLSAIRGPDSPDETPVKEADTLEWASLKDRYTRPLRQLLLGEDYQNIISTNLRYPMLLGDHFKGHAEAAEAVLEHYGFNKREIRLKDEKTGLPKRKTGFWRKLNHDTTQVRPAIVLLPKISVAGSEVEVAVHLRAVPRNGRRDPSHT